MTHPTSPLRTTVAYGLVLLSPVIAWLVWVSWSDGKATDAMHVAWFATIAVACTLAGALAPRRTVHLVPLAAVAILSAMTTLFLWWSSEDSSGLFLVGIMLATPLVTGSAVALLLLGRRISARPQRGS